MTEIRTPDPKGENNLDAFLAMLRSLRLREMADDLAGLLEEPARDGWGQLELLFELFQREDVRKHQRRYERNLKASRFSECYGIEHSDFDLAREHGLEPSLVRDLAQCEFVRARRNLILAGGVGTGKTYLARTLGREALKRGFKVFVFNTADLLGMLFSKRDSFQFGKIYDVARIHTEGATPAVIIHGTLHSFHWQIGKDRTKYEEGEEWIKVMGIASASHGRGAAITVKSVKERPPDHEGTPEGMEDARR